MKQKKSFGLQALASDGEEEAGLIDEANLEIDGDNLLPAQVNKRGNKPMGMASKSLAVDTFGANENSEEYYNETESYNSRQRNPDFNGTFSEDELE